jgi:hypothetical protein
MVWAAWRIRDLSATTIKHLSESLGCKAFSCLAIGKPISVELEATLTQAEALVVKAAGRGNECS